MEAPPSLDLADYASSDPDVLFNEAVLKRLAPAEGSVADGLGRVGAGPGAGLRLRPLERGDFDKGYLALLSQLTHVGDYGKERYEAQFDGMRAMPGCHFVLVAEEAGAKRLVCTATLQLERKFIHGAALRGRIEDIVVEEGYRKLRLGSHLVHVLTALSRELGCYKVTLDCKPAVAGFYEKCGFSNEGQVFLTRRFFD